MTDKDQRRFPIGPFEPRSGFTPEERQGFIAEIEALPGSIRKLVSDLPEDVLDRPYRDGGWTVRQVVHHIPDSHLQGYIRFKLALSEDVPTIKTYVQAAWGEMEDARSGPVEPSLALLDGLHRRWGFFLRTVSEEDFRRTYRHPDMGELSLETTLQLYAWHGRHHLGHIRLVVGR